MTYTFENVYNKIKSLSPDFSDTAIRAVAVRIQKNKHDERTFMHPSDFYTEERIKRGIIRRYFREYLNSNDYPKQETKVHSVYRVEHTCK